MIHLDDLLATTSASLAQEGSRSFARPRFDSRKVEAGDLFFALQGERDGHDFVADALANGAVGVVVTRAVPVPAGVAVVVVPDTLSALQEMANRVRQRYRGAVVAITGSVGKTTLKTMASAVLASTKPTFSSRASFNNHIGVPMTLLGLDASTECAVVEIGTNGRGEVAALAELVDPDVAVVTGVGLAHIGNFAGREELAAEKTDLYRGVRAGGHLVVNGDDDLVAAQIRHLDPGDTTRISVGLGDGNDLRAVDIAVDASGTHGRIVGADEEHPFTLRLVGRHFARQALAALAIGLHQGIDLETGIAALADVEAERGRAYIAPVSDRLTVIDDSYNASPDAVLAALDLLADLPEPVKVAVLGEMRELGDWTEELHVLVGRKAAETATHLIAIGSGGRGYARGALDAGLDPANVLMAESAAAAYKLVLSITAGEQPAVVLTKGSRFAHTERVALGLQIGPPQCELGTCTLYINCSTCEAYAPSWYSPADRAG